jgi:hypothetical protein
MTERNKGKANMRVLNSSEAFKAKYVARIGSVAEAMRAVRAGGAVASGVTGASAIAAGAAAATATGAAVAAGVAGTAIAGTAIGAAAVACAPVAVAIGVGYGISKLWNALWD